MARRGKLPMVVEMTQVQRVRRLGAEAAMAEAALASRKADEAERQAAAAAVAAREDWAEHLGGATFAPEMALALSGRFLARVGEEAEAAAGARDAQSDHAQKQQAWQRLEAVVRRSEQSIRQLRRGEERRKAEKRLAEVGDRTTYDWSRR